MLRFFRLIRRKLIEEQKTRQYIWYALGEIMLVMVGILLALQVNNWNVERIERAEERQILINLKTEFNQAIEQLSFLNELRLNLMSSVDDLIEISNNDGPFEDETIDSLFVNLAYSPTFNDPTGSLNSLISSNRINLISNNDLKVALLAWPRESEDMIEDERREVKVSDMYYRPFLFKSASISDIQKKYKISDVQFNKTNTEKQGLSPSKYVQKDIEGLLSNKEFINILHTRSIFMNIGLHESNIMIGKANDIIAMIDQELGAN